MSDEPDAEDIELEDPDDPAFEDDPEEDDPPEDDFPDGDTEPAGTDLQESVAAAHAQEREAEQAERARLRREYPSMNI